MKRILCVENKSHLSLIAEEAIRIMRGEWVVSIARGGEEALMLLRSYRYDAIVSDTNTADMGTAELFAAVKRRYPDMARVVVIEDPEPEAERQSIQAESSDDSHLIGTLAKALASQDDPEQQVH